MAQAKKGREREKRRDRERQEEREISVWEVCGWTAREDKQQAGRVFVQLLPGIAHLHPIHSSRGNDSWPGSISIVLQQFMGDVSHLTVEMDPEWAQTATNCGIM